MTKALTRLMPSAGILAAAIVLHAAPGLCADAPGTPAAAPPPGVEAAEPDGTVNASSLRPIPQGTAVTVKPWDNSEDTIDLARYIEDQLRTRGYAIGGASAVVLKFSMSEILGQLSTGPQRQLVEIDGQAGSATENEAQVRLNLFSTDKGGVFNQGRPQQKVASTQTLEMSIDRPDGQRLWLGEATGKLVNQDRRQSVRILVGPLLDNIGKTARSQPFGVPDPNKDR
jgi:hypothetical protein